MHDSQPLRLSILGIVAVALFTALFARLWFLQVMAAPDYQAQGEFNRTRTIVVEGPRGRILDRHGEVLADNREAVVVTVNQATLRAADDPAAVLHDLVEELRAAGVESSVEEIEERIANWNGGAYRPIVVAEDVPDELYFTLGERTSAMPGVGVERVLQRAYPNGSLAAHVLGYVGEINADELEARRNAEKSYQLGDTIGKSGVEQQYESQLRGTPGSITFEVDSMGRIVSILERVEPRPGNDLWLTVDADIQAIAETALAEETARAGEAGRYSNDRPVTAPAGSAVVVSPRTGEVLSMASHPTFDPNELVRGVSSARYEELTDRERYAPLMNRAIRGVYAPGSTFKIFTAYGAATTGLRDPNQWVQDTGSHTLSPCTGGRCTFYNSGRASHGSVDMRRALTVSSNVYFFQLGEEFAHRTDTYGTRPIQDVAAMFGLGQRTGIPLPLETGGVLIDPELRRQRHEENPEAFPEGEWRVGDTVNLAIGQGEIGVTPLQLANAYATMGNGGTLRAPTIALRITDPVSGEVVQEFGHRDVRDLELDQGVRSVIVEGLIGVTQRDEGTASTVYAGFPHAEFPVAGKTGTAQASNKASSSVFAAFAPAHDPDYAVAVHVEEGGYGSFVAAPISRRILEPLALQAAEDRPLDEGEVETEVPVGGALD